MKRNMILASVAFVATSVFTIPSHYETIAMERFSKTGTEFKSIAPPAPYKQMISLTPKSIYIGSENFLILDRGTINDSTMAYRTMQVNKQVFVAVTVGRKKGDTTGLYRIIMVWDDSIHALEAKSK